MIVFRRLASTIARDFPSKVVSDRILPYGTLLIGTIAAASALIQYSNNLSIGRVNAAMEMYKQFQGDTFVAAKDEFSLVNNRIGEAVVTLRCQLIATWAARKMLQLPAGPALDCQPVSSEASAIMAQVKLSGDLRRDLRLLALHKSKQILETAAERKSIIQLELFYRSVIVCVQQRNCSGEATAALFARNMVEFVNTTCPLDATSNRTTNDEIAAFLIQWGVHKNIYWNTDPDRQKLFACERQRALED